MFTLIKNIKLLAPEDQGIKDILICNDKIIKVAAEIDFQWEGLKVIDGSGKTAMPGLIDQHVHITGGGGENGFASLIREVEMTDCIKSGVTTVVGLLGTDSMAKSVDTLVAKAKGLTEQGITAYCLTGSYMYPANTLTDTVRKDISFISEVIGVKIAISDHRCSNVSNEELARVATEARYAGLLAKKAGEVHIHLGRGKAGLKNVMAIVEDTDIPITTFRPTHCNGHLEDAIKFAKMGGYVDFSTGSDTSATAKTVAEVMTKVPNDLITISSDSNGSLPKWNDNLEIIGMGVGQMATLYETIRKLHLETEIELAKAVEMVTANVAKALAIYPVKGCVAVNSDADLLIVDENLDIDTVIAKGQLMMEAKQMTVDNYYNYDE